MPVGGARSVEEAGELVRKVSTVGQGIRRAKVAVVFAAAPSLTKLNAV